ncbi:hypothetical protein MPTK1_2g10070 [Marchantia polymorpha subsp. ruderalis]|nr:hypothetical protein MARPO_0129s0032 [Marchantia polymorpha]BBN01762.1 hypothetical protein Mp_2g10070 [Marchantia polymorpha subsp. ruderalis]|eukprot:PTQ30145.1 hypothetical protein MARPO_0129s0032 [Marchantia polymorpha]
MWCPTPKPKVIPRPKPTFRHHHHHPPRQQQQQQLMKADAAPQGNDGEREGRPKEEEQQQQQQQPDPHRDARHYGMKRTDITRRFCVEDRGRHVPCDQSHGLRKTDITRYLERVVPSHAFQPSPSPPQTPRSDGDRCARRPRSRCDALRPDTAPTGEMKRLSASSAGTVNFGSRRASSLTPSPLKPLEAPSPLPPGSPQASEPGAGGLPDSDSGSRNPRIAGGTGCTLMAPSAHLSGGRLQSVPE